MPSISTFCCSISISTITTIVDPTVLKGTGVSFCLSLNSKKFLLFSWSEHVRKAVFDCCHSGPCAFFLSGNVENCKYFKY